MLGLGYICQLLQHPYREFRALDLLAGPAASVAISESSRELISPVDFERDQIQRKIGDAGPALDTQAKQEIRTRILELRSELQELRENDQFERGEKIEAEIDFLTRELARALGLGGRDRRAGSVAERARLNVTRAIRAAIQKIADHDTILGELLYHAIRTGSYCSYFPKSEPSIVWRFSLEPEGVSKEAVISAPLPLRAETILLSAPSDLTAFVGRKHERALMRQWLERARNREGRIVVVSGPPGIGKTRLSREVGEEARRLGFIPLAGNCYDREDSVPFEPFVELLEAAIRSQSPEIIRTSLGNEAVELSRLLPQLRRILPDLQSPLQVSPDQSRRMLFNAVRELITRQSSQSPILLLLEDMQWADEGSLALLAHLARSISGLPLMVIATHRDAEVDLNAGLVQTLDECTRLGVVERVHLLGLPQTAVEQMIEALSGSSPSPALVQAIYANSEGNPFFVEELVRDLERNHRHLDLSKDLTPEQIDLPQSLRFAIKRRLERVTSETFSILAAAAVIGRSFTFALLERTTGIEPEQLIDRVEETEKMGLTSSKLQYPEARFRFTHELIRRAVLDQLSIARLQRLHLNVAHAIETLNADALEDRADDLAHHYWNAGEAADPAKAVLYLKLAGDKAVRSSANVKAIEHFRKALHLIEKLPDNPQRLQLELPLRIVLGTALIATRGFAFDEVEAAFSRARDLCKRTGGNPHLFPILFGLWVFYLARAEHRTAHELAQECMRIAESTRDQAQLLEAHHALGVTLLNFGEFAPALEHLEQAIAIYHYEEHGPLAVTYGQDSGVVCLAHAAWALWFLGYPDQAAMRNRQALELAKKVSHPYSLATACDFAAWFFQLCRDPTKVQEYAEVAITLSTERDFGFYRAMGLILRGWAAALQEQKEQGVLQIHEGLAAFRATGARIMLPYHVALLAEALGEAGFVKEALERLSEASAETETSGESWWCAEILRLKGEMLLRLADLEKPKGATQSEAEHCFNQALSIARAQGARALELRAAMSLSRLRRQQGKENGAHLELARLMETFDEGLNTPDLRMASALLNPPP
ncbi:MAG TPA: AAA family ATPase [Candidatus Binataceae bacterium]|nr:AAA family ATPase [Candidatus Binataceae bacterium]